MNRILFNWKKIIIHMIIVVVFISYLILADGIYGRIMVGGESRMQKMSWPEQSNQIQSCIDKVEPTKKEWKNLIIIRGWGYLLGQNTNEKNKIYLVLKSDNNQYLFETNLMFRPDVTEAFKESKLNLDYSGFNALISKNILENGKYNIGLLIENGHNRELSYSYRYLTIHRNTATLE